jgi:hypothetical protein
MGMRLFYVTVFADFFLRGVLRFCWGFWGNWSVDVVFLWSGCGGLGGKGGLREDRFWRAEIRHFLRIYFGARRTVRALHECPP